MREGRVGTEGGRDGKREGMGREGKREGEWREGRVGEWRGGRG